MAYLSTHPPIKDISILSAQGCISRQHREPCFLMILSGEVQVQSGGQACYLNDYGLMLVEPDTPFDITGHGSNLLMIVLMDYDFFMQGSSGRFGQLVCNSAQDDQRDYSPLRQMLSHLALTHFEQGECRQLRELEICYSLLYYLNTLHFVPGGPELSESQNHALRGRQIISYIESNYMHDIRLDDLSEATYLSPTYLSRLFKKIIGTNFKSYLEEVRLRHAVEDMRVTDETITTIAYNNGFPNVSALSTAIRRAYNMSPNEFRRSLTQEDAAADAPTAYDKVDYQNVRDSLELLAGPEKPKSLGIYHFPDQLEYTVRDVSDFRPIRPIWKAMINVGTLRSLNNVNIRSQLFLLQDEIGFHYARVEGVLSEASIPSLPDGQYNFSYFDRAMELLLSFNLVPFLDLSYAADSDILVARSGSLYRGDKLRVIPDDGQSTQKVSALIRHCINTFGAGEVEKWGVELCVSHDEDLNFLETPEQFVHRFAQAYTMLKAWLPNMPIGGPEQHIAKDDAYITQVASLLHQRGITPDFFSLCAVPYEPTLDEGAPAPYVISAHPDYIRDRVASIRRQVQDICGPVPIWVTVLSPDIRTRNHVNDSCYQATFFVKNTVDLIGLADLIGYWQLSDVDTEYKDTTRILFGGTGILSKDGLKKPGFTVLKRLHRMNTLLIQREGNILATTNAINTYNILLFNHAHFTDLYCLTNGEDVTCDNAYSVFKDAATRDISITLNGLLPGRYKLVITTLNRENGSLFDEWLHYGILDNLQPQDIQYLQDIVHPQRVVRHHLLEDGILHLNVQMLPHEVKFLLLLREL